MAAGLGFKDFTTGEVLTAADVDGYLMQGVWVFASAAARDASVTSPQEGNFAYLKDTNVTTYYTGSAWANLDTTGMTNPMTTTGDTIYSSSGSTPARLGIGTAGQVLTVNAGATAPEWKTPSGGGGKVLQVVSASATTQVNIATTTYTDSGITATITPSSTSSTILIIVSAGLELYKAAVNPYAVARLLRDSTEIQVYDPILELRAGMSGGDSRMMYYPSLTYVDSPATTSARTYKIQGKLNSTADSQRMRFQNADTMPSHITLLEIGA